MRNGQVFQLLMIQPRAAPQICLTTLLYPLFCRSHAPLTIRQRGFYPTNIRWQPGRDLLRLEQFFCLPDLPLGCRDLTLGLMHLCQECMPTDLIFCIGPLFPERDGLFERQPGLSQIIPGIQDLAKLHIRLTSERASRASPSFGDMDGLATKFGSQTYPSQLELRYATHSGCKHR